MNVTIRHDYRPLLGPVRDQGARPTCLAHASTTAHEHARGSKTWMVVAQNSESAGDCTVR